MPQIAFVKYFRSSFFVKPASCETLLRRTSTSRFTPALSKCVKKVSADFLVKPIVKIFIRPRSWLVRQARVQGRYRLFATPGFYTHLSRCPHATGTYRFQARRAGSSGD